MVKKKGRKTTKTPTKQGEYKVGNKKPPIDKQFGKPGGNPRHNGAWRKEDTLRFKWEQMLKMSDEELRKILKAEGVGRVEKMTAEVLLDGKLKSMEKLTVLEKLATQVYGQPKQTVEKHTIEYKPLVDLTKRRKNGKDNGTK